MNSEQDLLNKLMISKKIMEKHNDMGRNGNQTNTSPSAPMVESFEPINASYNIPQEFISEQQYKQPSVSNEVPTKDRILNSKLPDEIKQLMLEHPIEKPNFGNQTTLSNELVEKASRLMNTKSNGEPINETKIEKVNYGSTKTSVSNNEIRNIVRETVEEVLKENGLLVESQTKSNEIFKFRVGSHIFEGKLTNIKKISK